MKRTVPVIIAAAAGFVLIVASFIPPVAEWGDDAMAWFNILAAIAFILGGANLLKMHLQKISSRRPGWAYSVITLVAFLATLYVGLGKVGVGGSLEYPDRPWASPYSQVGSVFWWVVTYLFTPLNATVFALLAFYIASASFRAFRAKNAEATVLLLTAFIVLWGKTYLGFWSTDWIDPTGPLSGLRSENMTETILDVFMKSGMRAITIGIALGVVATSLKVLLGVDRSYLGAEE